MYNVELLNSNFVFLFEKPFLGECGEGGEWMKLCVKPAILAILAILWPAIFKN
jgi:hypothetical protein